MENIKNFEEFTTAVVEGVKEFLPERFGNAEISLQTVIKNNNMRLTGLIIRAVEDSVTPNIYLENFFEKYKVNQNFEEILKEIVDMRMKHDCPSEFDTSMIMDFEKAKSQIFPRLVNRDRNENLLNERPHTDIENLTVTYAVMVSKTVDGIASAPITYQMMNVWGITVDELHSVAVENLPTINPSKFGGMSEVIMEMMGESDPLMESMFSGDEMMYVLSNITGINGATALLDEQMMNEIYESLGAIYILPSSIHECIIVRTENMNLEELKFMVCEVNCSQVPDEDILSNSVYTWNPEEGLQLVD